MARPAISVIVPAAGAPDVFPECLSALFSNTVQPLEVLLIDDGMDARAHEIASRHPVSVLKNPSRGVSAARNFGASQARGDVVLFTDTDVVMPLNAIELIADAFERGDADGLIGVQSGWLRHANFFSRYKNHWMRHTYHRLTGPVHLFYTSCAAIRRERFLQTGGFDENYRLPSVEDTAYGAVLGRNQATIRVLHALEIEHVKFYDFAGMVRTDINRSASLLRFVIRNWLKRSRGGIRKTSVPKRFTASAAIMGLAWLLPLLMPWLGPASVAGFLTCCVAVMAMNASWIAYLSREEGIGFGARAALFLPLNLTIVDIGLVWGGMSFVMGKKY